MDAMDVAVARIPVSQVIRCACTVQTSTVALNCYRFCRRRYEYRELEYKRALRIFFAFRSIGRAVGPNASSAYLQNGLCAIVESRDHVTGFQGIDKN